MNQLETIQRRLGNMTAEELSRVYMNLFLTDEGQLVLEDLRNRAYSKVSTVQNVFGPVDLGRTAFNEGQRALLLHIETQLTPEPQPEKKEADNA